MDDKSLLLSKYEQNIVKNNQEITVFVLTYNREYYLKKALLSILEQTYTNFTVIVLDNYSVDNTEEMVKSLDDERLLYIKHISDLVTGKSNMRYAFEICKTRYLVSFHDDDLIENTFIERALEEIKLTGCTALSVGGKIMDEDDNLTGRLFSTTPKTVFKSDEYFSYMFSHNADSMLYPSVIYDRSFFDDIQKYITVMEVGPCNDQFLWFQICRYGGSICIDDLNLMHYRVHSHQDSSLNTGFIDFQFIDALNKIPYYKKLVDKYYKKIVVRIIRRYIQICEMFYSGKISRKRFSEVFNYNCINDLNNGCTKPLYFFIVLMFKNKMFSKFILKLEKRRLSIKNNEK